MSSFPEFLSRRISCSADTKQGSTLGCWYINLKKGLFYVVNTDSTSLTKGKDKGRAGDVLRGRTRLVEDSCVQRE